jgi:hypothetical protein
VLDLRKLTFMDSAGVRLIINEDRLARSTGGRFSLVRGVGAAQRVLDLCGLSRALTSARQRRFPAGVLHRCAAASSALVWESRFSATSPTCANRAARRAVAAPAAPKPLEVARRRVRPSSIAPSIGWLEPH